MMTRPSVVAITTTASLVVTFTWSKVAGLYLCDQCRGGVIGEADCQPHAEQAHGPRP
jgi:hypothetical protein